MAPTWVRRSLGALVASALLCASLVAAVSAALSVPLTLSLNGYPAPKGAATARIPGGVAPLSARLLNGLFGVNPTSGAPLGAASTNQRGGQSNDVFGSPAVIVHAFTNDDFERAYQIRNLPFSGATQTATETRQPGEPSSCSPVGGTAWYRYTPSAREGLFASTFGTDYPDALGVFQGPSLSHLTKLGCSTSSSGNAQIGFPAVPGTTYYLQITGPIHGGGLKVQLRRIANTELVSMNNAGAAANGPNGGVNNANPTSVSSYVSQIVSHGRYVLFLSNAVNLDPRHNGTGSACVPSQPTQLVSGVHGTCFQLYLRDRRRRTTTLVSRGTAPPNGSSLGGSISEDGRFIVFSSYASNIVPGDTNNLPDVFLLDRSTGTVTRESVSPDGAQAITDDDASSGSLRPRLSADGRWLVFDSDAINLGAGNNCGGTYTVGGAGCHMSYLKDLTSGRLIVIGVTRAGVVPDGDLVNNGLSPDGSLVAFSSFATTWGQSCQTGANPGLVVRYSGCLWEQYLWSRATDTVTCLSCNAVGQFGDQSTGHNGQTIGFSADDRYIGFGSLASNLVPGDTNGIADEFLYDRHTRRLRRISLTENGQQIQQSSANAGQTASPSDGWISMSATHTGSFS